MFVSLKFLDIDKVTMCKSQLYNKIHFESVLFAIVVSFLILFYNAVCCIFFCYMLTDSTKNEEEERYRLYWNLYEMLYTLLLKVVDFFYTFIT